MMLLLHPDESLSGSGLGGRKGPKNRPFRGCQEVRGAGEAVCARASDATASHGARTVDLAVHTRIGEEPKKKVLHPTPGRVSCFLSDRVPRRDLTGPAPPAGIRGKCPPASACGGRSEEHQSELQSLMRNSYDVFFLKKQQHETDTH